MQSAHKLHLSPELANTKYSGAVRSVPLLRKVVICMQLLELFGFGLSVIGC